MSIVFDTSIVIDILRNDGGAVDHARSLEEAPMCSEVTRVEVMRGLRAPERPAAERLLRTIRWIAVDEPIARRAGELGRRWDRHRPGMSVADLVVAATVQEVDAGFATMNARHFPMFEGLQPPYRSR
jgi:predicted nucleic acid-binding protein